MAAHFSRADNGPLVVVSLALPLILLVSRPWAARLTQLLVFIAGVEWLRTTLVLVAGRQDSGEPWVRLAVILVSVALFTMASSLVFRSPALRARYSLRPAAQQGPSS
ncbi:MAG: hypothetical protein P8X82_10035 [Gemmatimonadales bacterium]|jgi:hypothetical protein